MIRTAPLQRRRDEAERPFWISFSDLMTALMVLFLVAMSVALLAVTHEISRSENEKAARQADIDAWMNRLRKATAAFPGVNVHGHIIDFGERARFDSDSHKLSEAQANLLREVVPHILALARDPAGSRWLKRIVVEGFADARGSYLHNLHLSLQRSERVLCVLLAGPPAPAALTDNDRLQVRQLFRVSGASFNALRSSPEESRRIELRLEFLEPDEKRAPEREQALDKDNGCPLERS